MAPLCSICWSWIAKATQCRCHGAEQQNGKLKTRLNQISHKKKSQWWYKTPTTFITTTKWLSPNPFSPLSHAHTLKQEFLKLPWYTYHEHAAKQSKNDLFFHTARVVIISTDVIGSAQADQTMKFSHHWEIALRVSFTISLRMKWKLRLYPVQCQSFSPNGAIFNG